MPNPLNRTPPDFSLTLYRGNAYVIRIPDPELPEGHSLQAFTMALRSSQPPKKLLPSTKQPVRTYANGFTEFAISAELGETIGGLDGAYNEIKYGDAVRMAGMLRFVKATSTGTGAQEIIIPASVDGEVLPISVNILEAAGAGYLSDMQELVTSAGEIADAVDASAATATTKAGEAVSAAGAALASQNAAAGSATGAAGSASAALTTKGQVETIYANAQQIVADQGARITPLETFKNAFVAPGTSGAVTIGYKPVVRVPTYADAVAYVAVNPNQSAEIRVAADEQNNAGGRGIYDYDPGTALSDSERFII